MVWLCHILLDGYLGCFHFLTIMKNACMNICVHVFVWTYIFISVRYRLKNRIAGSYGNSMLNLLRNCQIAFQSGCIILHPHQQCARFPFSPHPCQHLLSFAYLIASLLVGVKQYLSVVLLYISLTDNDVDHLFTCLLAIYISSSEKCL